MREVVSKERQIGLRVEVPVRDLGLLKVVHLCILGRLVHLLECYLIGDLLSLVLDLHFADLHDIVEVTSFGCLLTLHYWFFIFISGTHYFCTFNSVALNTIRHQHF